MERTFGPLYERLTDCALDEIRASLRPGSFIVDFGAGCGRLSLPLAKEGYRVTAVDPSGPMLAELIRRTERESVAGSIVTNRTTLQDFRSDIRHDMALCVFSVCAHLLDEQALEGAIGSVARSLAPDGLFLLDVPREEVFTGFDHDTADLIRAVTMEAIGGGLYAYRESTTLRTPGGQESYQDAFTLRHWSVERVERALIQHGFRTEDDVSARFSDLGADYLLVRRS